ncbi:MAG: TetR/AcrR family transcriptional regulator [Candidatus Cloacimonetes bacterium]|nr:TetR/AcrR family transcriptional regulator [Candidatus Cloacimonadota bacterium]
METKEKIIETAIMMFNRDGYDSVTTNHICNECKISPGNLYYHFKNKQEIVKNIYLKMIHEFDDSWSPIHNAEELAEVLSGYWLKIIEHQKRYSFFFLNLFSILQKDVELKNIYNQNREKRFVELKELILSSVSLHILREIDDSELDFFTHSIWFVNEFWLLYENVSNQRLFKQKINGNIKLTMMLLESYLPDDKKYLIKQLTQQMELK